MYSRRSTSPNTDPCDKPQVMLDIPDSKPVIDENY